VSVLNQLGRAVDNHRALHRRPRYPAGRSNLSLIRPYIKRSTVQAATWWPWQRRWAVISRRPYMPSVVFTVERTQRSGRGRKPRDPMVKQFSSWYNHRWLHGELGLIPRTELKQEVGGWLNEPPHQARIGPAYTGALMAKPLWTIEELSLSVPVATIYKWRSTGEAPSAHKIGRY
jgi:hypothetical protein